jgi:hypothetical protein
MLVVVAPVLASQTADKTGHLSLSKRPLCQGTLGLEKEMKRKAEKHLSLSISLHLSLSLML